jgi:phosphomannomutase
MHTVQRKIDQLGAIYSNAKVYTMDGVSVEYPDWHFNVRPSNTEPLLRLNLEATTKEEMQRRRDEVLAVIRAK